MTNKTTRRRGKAALQLATEIMAEIKENSQPQEEQKDFWPFDSKKEQQEVYAKRKKLSNRKN